MINKLLVSHFQKTFSIRYWNSLSIAIKIANLLITKKTNN